MIPRNFEIEPGQPWEMSRGNAAGPLPFSRMKWMSIPSTGALKCGNRLSRASCARQSNPSSHQAHSSFM